MNKFIESARRIFLKNELAKTVTILIGIILLGMTLRLWNLGANSFIADEFLDMNSSYAYRMTHTWQAWDFNFGQINVADVNTARDERAWLYKWQVAQVLKLLPPTEENARLVSVFWGLVSILLIYGVSVSFTKKRTIGLLSALLFAVSAMGIMFDRKLRMYAMFYPAYLALSWLVYKLFEQYYDKKNTFLSFFQKYLGINILFLIPVVIVGLVSLHLQLLTVNIVAAFFGYVLIQSIVLFKREKKISFNKYNVLTLLMLFGGFVGIKFFPGITGIFVASLKFFINNSGYFAKILSDYNSAVLAIIFFLIGAWYLFKKLKLEKETLWLLTSVLVPLCMAAFLWKRTQGIQYIFFVQSFLIILVAAGIYGVADFLRTNIKRFPNKSFAISIVLALMLLPNYGYFFEDNNTYHRSDVGDYRKVMLYVKKNFKKDDVVITRNFRNYYLSGMHAKVLDFGGEAATSKFSLQNLQQAMAQNPRGWVVLFDNDQDFLTKEVYQYINKNLSKVDNANVRGQAEVYYWGQ